MTDSTIQQTCDDAFRFISAQQQPDGGFASNNDIHSSVFYTGLIVSILQTTTNKQKEQLFYSPKNFLLKQKRADWTFQYDAQYPPDLDDTAVALRTLYLIDPAVITEAVLADIVNVLIANETAAGGPYQTWIMNDRPEIWHDVDIVVNSNIARFLNDIDIEIPVLQEYFETVIQSGVYSSKYYYDEIIIIYFLSAVYQGNNKKVLMERLLSRQNQDGTWDTALFTAMATTALLRLGADIASVTRAIAFLIRTNDHGSWPHQPLFIETIQNSSITYSSCDAYVSACCLEALQFYQAVCDEKSTSHTAISTMDHHIVSVFQACRNHFADSAVLFQQQLDEALALLSLKDPKGEIPLLAYQVWQHLRPEYYISETTIAQLSVMNTLGWIGYTICDKIVDGEPLIASLPFGMQCIQIVSDIVHGIITTDRERAIIERILHDIPAATAWEYKYCRLVKGILPDYGDYAVLAQKSLGHALGPIAICFLCKEYTQAVHMEAFFTHYLIARQLHDDAHDWIEDLKNGFVNGVSASLLQTWQKTTGKSDCNIETDLPSLQALFWQEHIDIASTTILDHCNQARATLEKITILTDVSFLEALLIPLEQGAQQAITERDSTQRFLSSFSASTRKISQQ